MKKKCVAKEKIKEGFKINKKIIILVLIILIAVISLIMLFLTVFNKDWQHASKDYKEIMEVAKKNNEELEDLINKSQKLVNSKESALDENLRPNLEDAISDAKAAKKKLPNKPIFTSAIEKKAQYLKEIDYTEEYEALEVAYNALDKSIKGYALVDQPDESYVIESLRKISSIDKISAVTEDNDPNGKLNKQGGYTAQVYFSSKHVNQNNISGKTVIDKGTKAGGSIEVYKTVEDAKKREDYLAGFDGSVLASGSHKVIGTVLIRTSDSLTATKQKELEANIIAALTGEEVQKEEIKEEKPVEQKPKYYSVVGSYSGPDGTIHFYQNGTLVADMIDRGITNPGQSFKLTGNWTQSGNNVTCRIFDAAGEWTPQQITVTKNGINNWWGDFYSKIK